MSEVPAIIKLSHSSNQKSLCYAFIMVNIVFINAGIFVVIKFSLICIIKEVKCSACVQFFSCCKDYIFNICPIR